ncbi:MAG: AAA family ATPase, partial [Firmicutes bacterium]|nr:AAA family ATPase [Bacillota bacterium]
MARAMAACMTEQGLSNGVFLEVGREQLLGRYLGETSLKVTQVFQKAQGGVLFIDEAGALVGGDGDSYGREAISAIVRHMENERETTVILATYPEEMEALMEENEGLRSRIGRMISFPDYDEEQLTEIFVSMAKSRGYQLEKNCEEILRRFFRKAMRSQQFGGGREVRRLLERTEGQLANYVMTHTVKRDQLRLLTNCAIEEAAEDLLGEGKEKEVRRPIGFAPSASL